MSTNNNKISDLIIASYAAEKENKPSIAIKNWNILLQEKIDNNLRSNTYLNLAKLQQQQGNNDISLEMIEKAIESNPNSGEAYFVLGHFKFEKQDWDGAKDNFKNALKFNQKDVGLYNNLANCYDRLGKFDKAITNYNKALKINNTYIASFYNRGNIYCKIKEYKKAIQDLSSAIKLDENFYQAYYNRGAIYKLINKNHLAEKDLKKAKELAQQDLNNKNNL